MTFHVFPPQTTMSTLSDRLGLAVHAVVCDGSGNTSDSRGWRLTLAPGSGCPLP